MTTTTQLAICCGPVVTTWDCRSDAKQENLASSFRPHGDNTPVVDVSWNTHGQVLASCSAVGNNQDNVVLTSTFHNNRIDSFRHDGGLKRPTTVTGNNTKATCVTFGVKSRYLIVGDDSGAVCLWDLKKKSRVRHYFHTSASLQASLDPTDQNVFSLTESALHIFRLREGTLAATITGSSRFTKFSTSLLEPKTVALGTRIGSIDLFDVSLQSKLLSMSPHTASVTGIAWSAVSKLLLASASVDETLAFSDISTGKIVQRMTLESPATSMSFHDNGRTCAVGTESGRVLVYDLRKPSDAIATRQVDGRVSALQFAPGGDAAVRTTSSKPKRSTLSLDKTSMDSAEQHSTSSSVDEVGRVVDSVLNRSRDSSNATTGGLADQRQNVAPLDKDAVREIVREELDAIRDEMEDAMRDLQVDMCRQFMKQSQEYAEVLAKLQEENDKLRQENEYLRQTNWR